MNSRLLETGLIEMRTREGSTITLGAHTSKEIEVHSEVHTETHHQRAEWIEAHKTGMYVQSMMAGEFYITLRSCTDQTNYPEWQDYGIYS